MRRTRRYSPRPSPSPPPCCSWPPARHRGGSGRAPPTPAGPPVSGGTPDLGGRDRADHLQPAPVRAGQGPAAGVELVRGAAHPRRHGGFLPWLATGYEVSADGLTYTVKLRTDVTFHDGEKFDAAAVKANFDQLLAARLRPGGRRGAAARTSKASRWSTRPRVTDHAQRARRADPGLPGLPAGRPGLARSR